MSLPLSGLEAWLWGFWRVHSQQLQGEQLADVGVSFLFTEMRLVLRKAAEFATYIAVMPLFLLIATISDGHNFYGIAKPTGAIALGTTFPLRRSCPSSHSRWILEEDARSQAC